MSRIDLCGGKYTVIHDNSGDFRALRNGKEWRSLVGDKLVLAMMQEIEHLNELAEIQGDIIDAREEEIMELAEAFPDNDDERLSDASRKLSTVFEIISEYERTGNTDISTELVKALLEPTRRAMNNVE